MAFESLSEKFTKIIKKVKGQSRLTESNMDDILKEIKIALLEADVNYKVVKEFVAEVKEKALGMEVFTKLNPSEMVVKIVRDELVELLGSGNTKLIYAKNRPTILMMVGLQGSGKTTTSAKLAYLMSTKENKKVLLVACDIYRPAAIDQLEQLANSINVDIYFDRENKNPVDIYKKSYEKAVNEKYDVLIVDTAGRLQIDDVLMNELKEMKSAIKPDEVLLLVDAMAGQDSVNVAKTFNENLGITGVIMSKMDGDSRGGAALSIAKVTNVPIKFVGTGEKINNLDVFHPDRTAERILGMGDILTLIDKVQENIDAKEMNKSAKRFEEGNFDLNDMLEQMKQVKKLGSFGGLLKLIPGMPNISKEQLSIAEKQMKSFEVIINSMTPYERKHPEVLKNSRKMRIAKGSGTTSADVNKVLKKYEQSKLMFKQFKNIKKGGKFPPGFNGF